MDEIAEHFDIKAPATHKYLKALQSKGYLYFGRTSSSGFFIRLIEWAGSAETVVEIAISGWFNRYGELLDFPSEIGHFATTLVRPIQENLFALAVQEYLPEASIVMNDLIIFDIEKQPQPGDICIAPIGDRLFLILIGARTYDRRTGSWEMRQEFPIPQAQMPADRLHRLFWEPLAYDDGNHDYFIAIAEKANWNFPTIPTDLIAGTALRLTRT